MTGSNGADGDLAKRIAGLKIELDDRRRDISGTLGRIEQRLAPDRMLSRASRRVEGWLGPWRERPGAELELLRVDAMTRVREMAWMNPLGLGLGAFVIGLLLGRWLRPR